MMYCINCGVQLAETEKTCPLCNTVVCHPDIKQRETTPLYPTNSMPKQSSGTKIISGAIVILFLIPIVICLFADLQINGTLDWFGYVAGALVVTYTIFALPLWFRKPNPVIFTPCGFFVIALYLLYISWATDGAWFLKFALPIVGGVGIIISVVVTLLYYLRRGKLYVLGGGVMALGVFIPLMEFLMSISFSVHFVGWSIYPMVGLLLLGALLIYLAMNRLARDMIERKLFF